MRILHVGKYFPPFAGGMEHFLADLAEAQTALGMQVAAIVHDERRGGSGERPLAGARVAVYRAPGYGQILYAPISPAFPAWLGRAIREFRPDLLHLHFPNTSAFAALIVPSARRLPWVIHWHSDVVASVRDPRLKLAYRLYRPFEQAVLARSRAVITTSSAYQQASEPLAGWADRCISIPLGLSPNRIREPTATARERANELWAGADLRILAIGRLTYYKGHEVLIQAAARLEDARTLIVGAGSLRGRLEETTKSLQCSERVRLVGYQPEEMLNALLATCDLLCLPSVERTEAFGLVQLEAMRFGKPVVVSDIPGSGAGFVVRQAGNGLLTPPDDPDRLTQQLKILQTDPELRGRLGAAGSQALDREFGIAAVAKRIAEVYRDIVPLNSEGAQPEAP